MGVSGQRHAPATLLPPGKGPPVPIVQEAGWAPEPVWTQRLEKKSSMSEKQVMKTWSGLIGSNGDQRRTFVTSTTKLLFC